MKVWAGLPRGYWVTSQFSCGSRCWSKQKTVAVILLYTGRNPKSGTHGSLLKMIEFARGIHGAAYIEEGRIYVFSDLGSTASEP